MNQRVIAVLVIVLMFGAFLFVTPRGKNFREKYFDEHFGVLGDLFRTITSKATGTSTQQGEKLLITITSIPPTDMNGQTLQLKGQGFTGQLKQEFISFAGGTATLAGDTANIVIPNMVGDVSFASGRIQISGKTSQLTLSGLSFNSSSTDFIIVGTPTGFSLEDVSKSSVAFPSITGSLSWAGLKGVPPLLVGDRLELFDFQGDITMADNKVEITGFVSRMKLNGVSIEV